MPIIKISKVYLRGLVYSTSQIQNFYCIARAGLNTIYLNLVQPLQELLYQKTWTIGQPQMVIKKITAYLNLSALLLRCYFRRHLVMDQMPD